MPEFYQRTIGHLIDQVAREHPTAEALVDLTNGSRMSYETLARLSDDLARGFMSLGLERGDRLGIWCANRPSWVLCQAAAAKAGLVLTILDIGSQADHLAFVLQNGDVKALVLDTDYDDGSCLAVWQQAQKKLENPPLPLAVGQDPPQGMRSLDQLAGEGGAAPSGELDERMESLSCHDPVGLIYTSGTTGRPKGVLVTHYGLINTSLAGAGAQRLSHRDRLLVSVPLAHMFGCVCLALTGLSQGACLVIPSRQPNTRDLIRGVEQENCTAIYGPPTTFIDIMEHPSYDRDRLASLRTGIMAGAVCPLEVMTRVVEQMGVEHIIIGYGQTESCSWISLTDPEDPLELRVSTVGRPLVGAEVKIIDPQSGEEAAEGQVGELCARGFVMKGYLDLPAATAAALDSRGWLHTGDLATKDGQGYLRITGRVKEAIMKGGQPIYPAELEEVLFAHPAVANAQIFGVPDPELGEEVAAWVRLEQDGLASEEELLQYLRAHAPQGQTPRYLKLVSEFPMTPLGKIQKYKMSQIYGAELGLDKG